MVSVTDLFLRTLAGDYDDEAAWAAVHALQNLGTREVFDIAARWCLSANALERARGADVLAQLGVGEDRQHAFPEEARDILLELLRKETLTRPMASAIVALGHLQDAATLPTILAFAPHDDAEVRHAAAFALGCFADDASSVAGLLKLTTDPDSDVRDWAAFGLGVMGDADTAEIRDALFRLLADPCVNVRMEAVHGLARRKDARALPVLIAALEQPEAPRVAIDAACAMLGREAPPEGWDGRAFARALRARFRVGDA